MKESKKLQIELQHRSPPQKKLGIGVEGRLHDNGEKKAWRSRQEVVIDHKGHASPITWGPSVKYQTRSERGNANEGRVDGTGTKEKTEKP